MPTSSHMAVAKQPQGVRGACCVCGRIFSSHNPNCLHRLKKARGRSMYVHVGTIYNQYLWMLPFLEGVLLSAVALPTPTRFFGGWCDAHALYGGIYMAVRGIWLFAEQPQGVSEAACLCVVCRCVGRWGGEYFCPPTIPTAVHKINYAYI